VSRNATVRRGFCLLAILTTLAGLTFGQQPATTPAPATPAPAQPPANQPAAAASESPDPLWTFGLFYWLPIGNPTLQGGAAAPDFETLGKLGKSKYAPEAELAIRVTKEDVIRLTVFETDGKSTSVNSQALDLFGTNINALDFVTDQWKVESAKASFEDLLYPFGRTSKLRFKTLWEVQATKTSVNVDAPFDTSLGGGMFPSVSGSHLVILPAFGMAVQYAVSPNFHLEARASGFGIPHHAETADAEASLAYRIGHIEIVLGGKLYDWKTSPKNAEYFHGMLSGGFLGLRWVAK
jgi:hypothetical protein